MPPKRRRRMRWFRRSLRLIGRPIAFTGRTLWHMVRFLATSVRQWWKTRNGRYLLHGVPAILAMFGLVGLTAATWMRSPDHLAARYRSQAAESLATKDYETALTCYERLTRNPGALPKDRFGLALTVDALGQSLRAEALFLSLAPDDRQGYPPAHLWRARRILQQPKLTAESIRSAEWHLLHALQGSSDQEAISARALLGELYAQTRRFAEAEKHLGQIVEQRPEFRMRLARFCAARGDKVGARLHANKAADYFRQVAEANLDDHQARLAWADAIAFLEDFPAAVAILRPGLSGPNPQPYHAALAQVYILWFDTLGRQPTHNVAQQLELLEQAMQHAPANPLLADRLSTLTQGDAKTAEAARVALRSLLANGKAAAVAHFALGVDAWQRGQADTARLHWEQAYRAAPHMATAGNNLAWLHAHTSPPDLPRALALIEEVIRRFPNEPRFRGTRGHIYTKMKRWNDALADLQASLAVYADNKDVHRTLAEVYEQLGDREQAAVHRRRAAK